MQSAGIVLILCGAFLIYEVLHSRLRSLSGSGGSSSGGGGSGGGSGSGSSQSGQGDIGTHQGIDMSGAVTGTVGGIYTINQAYGDMAPQQQDDANAYARQIGNVG